MGTIIEVRRNGVLVLSQDTGTEDYYQLNQTMVPAKGSALDVAHDRVADPYHRAREVCRAALVAVREAATGWTPSAIDKRIIDETQDLIGETMTNCDNLSNAYCAALAAKKGGAA